MTDIEPKEKFRQIGIDLINEYRVRGGFKPIDWLAVITPETSAFIRSIQLHEKTKQELRDVKQELADFKQEVSDALVDSWYHNASGETLERFIIPKPKPDPLVEAMKKMGWYLSESFQTDAENFDR
ncbi:MAG: hypothetical protein JGK24_30445 [Microcoleus sp. PH2017_29_MFU_D_A]|uniref:hypothetical protein n=1 Tax=Microcoleus sp. PH2017_29_MFU_D_A TaxID=2798839 RepID=UPI001DA4C361|nr:hypothetical protein [Microcoleus sp. PH2017_29_MFU_D_A]MCC3607431.1 hypothetical protein [Microcoleus sp. PH2017_29_MFU_D_A]